MCQKQQSLSLFFLLYHLAIKGHSKRLAIEMLSFIFRELLPSGAALRVKAHAIIFFFACDISVVCCHLLLFQCGLVSAPVFHLIWIKQDVASVTSLLCYVCLRLVSMTLLRSTFTERCEGKAVYS